MNLDPTQHVFHSPEFQGLVEEALTFLNTTPTFALPPSVPFQGSGIYGLYYHGNYPLYLPLASANLAASILPIYVGKTVPPGWRTARNPNDIAPTLFRRLQEHARSIQVGAGLELADFRCRMVILHEPESELITLLESALIRRYLPLWNSVIDGFGNHDPGSGRYQQAPSEWDILHPGRPWVLHLSGTSATQATIIAKVRAALGT